MNDSSFMNLIYNTALLLMLVFIFDLFTVYFKKTKLALRSIPFGIAIGLMGIIVIKTHWTLESGAIFDTRSILLGISGIYFGLIPTVIAMVMTALYRILEGGVGIFTGISVIIATGTTGILWGKFKKIELHEYTFGKLYIFGVVIHIMMILLMFTFPWNVAKNVLTNITLPVMVIYPVGTALLGIFMTGRLQKERFATLAKEEEKKFKILADYTTNWDYWTSPDNKFLYCSASCLEITGYSDKEFMDDGDLMVKIIHPDDLKLFYSHYSEVEKHLPGKADFRIIHKSGRVVWIGHSCAPIFNGDGTFLGIRGSNKDITTRIEAEKKILESKEEISKLLEVTEQSRMVLLSMVEDQKLIQDKLAHLNFELEERVAERTSQLENANKELEAFSYSVSHDLRAPLRGISGFINILIDEYGSQLDDEGQRLCGVIRDNSQKMGQLIDDLLSFSRLSRKELQKSIIDIETMVSSLYHEITTPDQRDKIKIRIGDLPDCVGDTTLMRQVIINLLSNSVKYSSKVESPQIEIYSERGDNFVKYCFKDNGAGFDMRYYEKLFGVFQRLHGAKEFEGTGVGLAIVQRIVHRHGGNVGAIGEIDKGATFWFTVPDLIIN